MTEQDFGYVRACGCVGPQNGQPVCPCMMPAYEQLMAERAAWERERKRVNDIRRHFNPRKSVSGGSSDGWISS